MEDGGGELRGNKKVNKKQKKGDITIKELPFAERPREKMIRYANSSPLERDPDPFQMGSC